MSSDKTWSTPGVYVNEINAFPPSVVGVATAVPAFVGHTARGPALKPTQVTSLADYEAQFGGGAPGFCLYESIALFYANGGRTCFVVSAGDFNGGKVDAAKLTAGLDAAGAQAGPTLIAIPDAVLLKPDAMVVGAVPRSAAFGALARAMLQQCGTRQDRIALLDVYGAGAVDGVIPLQQGIDSCIAQFQADVGDDNLSYGAAYFPLLQVEAGAAGQTIALPASGAIAGIIAATDVTRGVWNAPANVTLNQVVHAGVKLNDAQTGALNMPVNGKSVNTIRDFAGRGPVVWGARTLDGNSNDWRYVQVRRTIVYIEQSIKTALQPFVFAANDGRTWVAVTAMISSFLSGLWQQGGLMGDKASDAFSVQCGLGSTMTGEDILNGYMVVQVTLQLIRPAEFIELTFKQQMQGG